MKKRNATLKKRWIVLVAAMLVVFVTALLCHIRVLSGIEFMRDSETGEIMTGTAEETLVQESVILRLDRDRISVWDGEIGVHLEYTGNEILVFGGWTLETRRNGTWTYLQRKPMNVNLVEIVLQNGDKETGALKFDQYGRFLPPGEYRLGVWLGSKKSAVEFEVTWW